MISALPKLVAAQYPRPASLSNEGCCYSDDYLNAILAKPDSNHDWADYQTLLTISRCTGTYEELVYFVPLALRYCQHKPDEAGDCVSYLVHFLSHELGRLKSDGFLQPVADALRELFADWTNTFEVSHLDEAACRANGYGLVYYDVVRRSELIRDFLEDLLRFESFAGLAEELVAALAGSDGGPRSAWFLEYAYKCRIGYARWVENRDQIRATTQSLLKEIGSHVPRDDTPPWSRSTPIVSLINHTELLRRHFDGIGSTLRAGELSPTYWGAIRGLLDFPSSGQASSPSDVPRFSADDARPYRPAPTPQPTADSMEGSGPLWPKINDRLQKVMAVMKDVVGPTTVENDAVADVAGAFGAMFAAMGRRFRGRVRGFEQEITFRLLLVSGNFALCENESGPLRIPFKDFAAACESGQLIELSEDIKPG